VDPNDPGGIGLWAELGVFVGGVGTVLLTRLGLRTREQREECEALVSAIRDDGAETRKILTAMRTDLSILLDRDDHRGRA
jgi:hypothetical protein